jgi:hypothetical protein
MTALADVFYVELVALMLEGVIEKPCRYDVHVPHVWFGADGYPRCGVCHPLVPRQDS